MSIYPASTSESFPSLNLACEAVLEQSEANSFDHLTELCSMKSDNFTYTEGASITLHHQMAILSLRYKKAESTSTSAEVTNPGSVSKIVVKISDTNQITSYSIVAGAIEDESQYNTTPLLVAPTNTSAEIKVTFYSSNGGVFTTTKSPATAWVAGGHYLATIDGYNLLENITPSSDGVDDPDYIASLEDESRYYTPPTSFAVDVNLVEDYGVDNTQYSEDDTAELQAAIDYVSSNGGGRITLPKGYYTFAWVYLKSNVHIEIEAGTVIRPTAQEMYQANAYSDPYWKNYHIFMLDHTSTSNQTYLENMSITGVGGQYTIDLAGVENTKIRCFQAVMARNFLISDAIILDDETIFAAVEFDGRNFNNVVIGPEYGVVKNIDNYNSIYGYGLMQMQYGRNILFSDLYSLGGVTVRLESHLGGYYETDCIEYIDGIVARDIRCENGHAAVMLSPHFVKNGWVDIRNISGVACESSLLIEGGFVSDTEASYGLTSGWFSSKSVFRDVKGVFSATDAQIHPKHFSDMIDELEYLLPSTSPWEAKAGPSIALIYYSAPYLVDLSLSDITLATDFLEGQYWIGSAIEDKVADSAN